MAEKASAARSRKACRKIWVLDPLGTLGAGKEKTIKRSGQPMALNNGGDTVELINPNHRVVHTVAYDRVGEEEMVFPAQ